MALTTIQLSQETRQKLVSMGKKGESYDALINRLISLAKKKEAVSNG